MYRIEVGPGEETVFRTIEELAVGIRNGVITPRARIYHHASQKWLPIGLHPHYKKALEMPIASASPAPVTTATPLPQAPRKTPSHGHPKLSAEPKHAPEPKHSPEPKHTPEPKQAAAPKHVPEPKPTPEPPKAPERKYLFEPKPTPKIPAPTQSPVLAMQQEVLRDLPMLSIPEPEPLPWQRPAPRVAAPVIQAHAPAVHHAAPVHHSAPVPHAAPAHVPTIHAPSPATAPHQAATYVPLEYSGPLAEPYHAEADEPHHRSTARRRRVGGRPVMLFGVAASLVVGMQILLSSTPSASADPAAEAEAEETAIPDEIDDPASLTPDPVNAPVASEAPARTPAARVTTAPARVPMVPGPAFAGSAPLRSGADTVATRPAPAPQPAAPVAASEIAPAPAAIDLGMPALVPDSLAPTARTTDTMGMKKILRALNGPKPAEAAAAP